MPNFFKLKFKVICCAVLYVEEDVEVVVVAAVVVGVDLAPSFAQFRPFSLKCAY